MSDSNETYVDERPRPQKLSPEMAQVRNQAKPRRLRKNVVIGVITALAGVLMLAFVLGILKNPITARTDVEVKKPFVADETSVPGFVKSGPQSYGDVDVPALGPAMQGDFAAVGVTAPTDSPLEKPPEMSEAEQRLAQELENALSGPVELPVKIDFKKADESDNQQTKSDSQTRLANAGIDSSILDGLKRSVASLSGSSEASAAGTGHQSEKRAFMENSSNGNEQFYVSGRLQKPLSPYEVKTGSVVPCTLITGINSDLPGDITCHVRQNVYDTVSGNYLLIPQGARAHGTYDSQIVFGQRRVLVIWHRLIMPNGMSLDLEGMPGVDMSGYAGYADKVNNHWMRLAGAVVLSSVFAAAPVAIAGSDDNFQPSVQSEISRNIGVKTKDAGDQIVERELTVQPTITIAPGFAINIFVKKDLVLAPYAAHSTHEINIDPATDHY